MPSHQTIIDLFNAGAKPATIASQLKLHRSLVYRTIDRFKKTRSVNRRSGSGRPRL